MTYRELLNLLLLGNEWGDIENKPSTFPPSQHTHEAEDITDLDDTYVPRQELKKVGLYPEAKWPEKTADYNDMTEQGVYYMEGYFHHNAPIVAGAMLLVFACHEEKFTRIVQIAMPNVTDYKHPTYQAGAFMRQSWTPDAEVEGEEGKEPKKRKWTSWLPFSPLLPRDNDTLLYYKNGNFESLTLEQLMNKFGADERYIKKLELSDKGIFPALNVQTRVNDFNAYQEQGGFWFPMGLHINAPPTKHGSLTHGALLVFNFQTGVVQIYYDALDDKLYSRRHEQQQWYPWKPLGGVAGRPPLLFTCPDNDNAMHLEIQYKEASSTEEAAAEEGSADDKGFKPLVKTSDTTGTEGGESGKKAKVKGYTGDSWIDCPATGFGSNFGGWPVMVDLTDVSEIDVSKIYYIRYRWVAKASNSGSGATPTAASEGGTDSNGEMASDWYSMVYPCATEAPVTSSPSASLPPIAEMKEGSVLVFEKGKYQAITYQEFQKKLSENGSSGS